MEESHVVTCFIEFDKKILLLKRSKNVGSYEERWAGVSGYIEEYNSPLEQALEEIREELKLGDKDVTLLQEGESLEVIDEKLGRKWIVHPFRFSIEQSDKIVLDWEHSEFKWTAPEDIKLYATVPNLYEAWERVR